VPPRHRRLPAQLRLPWPGAKRGEAKAQAKRGTVRLTHLERRRGQGHREAFLSAREDLGHATGHLLPAITVLVQKVFALPVKPTDDQRRVAGLERQLARALEARQDGKRAAAEVVRLQRALDEARAALTEAEAERARVRTACEAPRGTCACTANAPAARVVDAAVGALLSRPPAGADADEVRSLARCHRASLIGLVRARLGGSP
jgi:hypothetical protein